MTDVQDYEKAVLKLTDDTWGVTGWVDAENSFGASIRQDFYLEMQLEGKTMTLLYLEMNKKVILGESIIPDMIKRVDDKIKAERSKKLDEMIISRQIVGGREYMVLKTEIPAKGQSEFFQQLAKDLASKAEKSRLFAWVYSNDNKPQGMFSITKQDHKFQKAPFKNPDPFALDGYFSFREWSSLSGQFKLKAKFSGSSNDVVSIVDESGKRRDIELGKLSKLDQEWVKKAPSVLPR